MVSQGNFMELPPLDQAWELQDEIHRRSESWSVETDSEGTTELDHNCINTFLETGRLEDLVRKSQLDFCCFLDEECFIT
jgi:hypothetical protein